MAISRDDCLALDADDPLAGVRDRFSIPEGVIYLDGNSLGALPKAVAPAVARTIGEEWGRDLIASWNTAGWFAAPLRIGARLAPMIGARAHEVAITDTISINLFKLLVAACRMRPDRDEIVCEAGNFPSDNHIVDSVARMTGCTVRAVPAGAVASAVGPRTAVATLSHVNYRTAEKQDMAAVTAAIHAAGALALWDLAHSTGAVTVDLDGAKTDFAVGCGYKYLNGGPGAPSHIFVAERHQAAFDQPLTGWFAHAEPFRFDDGFRRAPDIRGALCSTPQILSLVAFEAALSAFDGVDMAMLEAKGRRLCDLMLALHDERIARFGTEPTARLDPARRGNHISFRHPDGFRIVRELIRRGVIGDFRAPDAMRFGVAPLYVRHVDVYDAMAILEDVLETGAWRHVPLPGAGEVT